jgi:hypothetical protein
VLAEPRLGRVSAGHRAPQHRKQQTAQYRVGRVRGLPGGKYAVVAALREHLPQRGGDRGVAGLQDLTQAAGRAESRSLR